MQLKVCGLTAAQDLDACVDAGVDAVGFVLVPSPRQVDPVQARDLGRRLPPAIARVAVFRHVDAAAISMALDAHATMVQGHFHPGMIPAARGAGLAVLPALTAGGDLAQAQALWDLGVPQVLIDGPDPGSGRASRWDHVAQIARFGGVVLAGGLTPENVAGAIAEVRPSGVDVSSGVESRRGVKDPARIRAFSLAARAAFGPT